MKSWNEAREDMIVYLNGEYEITDDNGNELGKTKLYQKGVIGNVYNDEVEVFISGGKFDGEALYFHPNEDKPSDLLTKEEYKLLSMTEEKVWKELKQFLKSIDALQNKSEDILAVQELILKNTP